MILGFSWKIVTLVGFPSKLIILDIINKMGKMWNMIIFDYLAKVWDLVWK